MINHKQEIKSFSNEVNNSKQSTPINMHRIEAIPLEVARVSICLTSKHKDCNEKYIDSFSGKYFIKCLCKCHNKRSKKEENKRLDRNLNIVESQKFHNSSLNSNRKCIKPYSSILDDICWCGHDRNHHSGLNQCNEKNCNCLKFSP